MPEIDPKSIGAFEKRTTDPRYFCAVYDFVEKADLSKGYPNPKRKLGATMHVSEIIEPKLPYILCILKLF